MITYKEYKNKCLEDSNFEKEYDDLEPELSNVKLFKGYLAKLIGDIFDCYDLIINLFGDQCQIIWWFYKGVTKRIICSS